MASYDTNRKRKALWHRRSVLVMLLGGRCELCGFNSDMSALEFHHIRARNKEFGLSAQLIKKPWFDIVREAFKCALLCANCHRGIHSGAKVLDVDKLRWKTPRTLDLR